MQSIRLRSRTHDIAHVSLTTAAVIAAVILALHNRRDDTPAAKPESQADVTRNRWQAKLPWAQGYAQQPIEILSGNYSTFLTVIQITGGDDRTWRGFARLVEHTLSADRPDPNLKRLLLQTSRLAPPPEWVRPLVDQFAQMQGTAN